MVSFEWPGKRGCKRWLHSADVDIVFVSATGPILIMVTRFDASLRGRERSTKLFKIQSFPP